MTPLVSPQHWMGNARLSAHHAHIREKTFQKDGRMHPLSFGKLCFHFVGAYSDSTMH